MAQTASMRAADASPPVSTPFPARPPAVRRGPARDRPTRGRVLLAGAVIEALTLVAALAWWPVYESTAFLLLAAVTVTAGTALAVLAAFGRWPAPAVAVSVVALWLVLGVPLAVPAKSLAGVLPTLPGLADLAVTTVTGWRQLLTIEIPVGDYQALLVPVFVLLLAASVIGVSVACRVARPARRVLAVVPAAVVLVAGLAFGGSTGFAPLAVGGGFAVLVVVWLALADTDSRPGAGRRRSTAAAAVGVIAVALVGAVAVTAAVPAPERSALRDTVEQPFEPGDYASPLAGYRAYLKAPQSDSVVLTVTGAPAGSRLVVARMDDYDGVVFSVGGADGAGAVFARVPERLAASSGGSAASVTAQVEVGDYSGVWVPTLGEPQSVRFTGPDAAALQNSLYFSPALGTVATTQGLGTGDGYQLTADPGAATADPATPLTSLTPGTGTVSLPAPGVVPDAVSSRAAEWAPASASPGERLAGIVAGLTAGYVSSGLEGEVFSRSGHGSDRIQELLTATPMVGDAEQYAAAGALLAEAAGFPARVALGFVLPGATADAAAAATSGTPAASGAPVELHGREATAWVEVYTAEAGWTPVDVMPEPRPIPEKPVTDDSTAVQPPQVVPPAADDLGDQVQSAPLQQDDQNDTPDGALLATLLRIAAIAGIVVVVLALLLAPFLTVIALKSRRRARRRERGSARDRAAGSWAEVIDAARDADLAPPRNATRREAARAIGGLPSVQLADRVDGALYSPEPPDEGQLTALWAASDDERRRLQGDLGWFGRLRARVSPRSLRDSRRRAYHGGSETKRR